MEIGQKTSTKKNNSLTVNNIKELSIQVNLSGLSFCILNRTTNTIEQLFNVPFEKKLTPIAILEKLKIEFSTNIIFSDTFNSINVIYQNELSTLVPEDLFNENNSADYLKFSSKILKTDYISHDTLPINKSVNVYVPYVNINNYIFDTFGEFDYKHASTILIDTILQKEKDNTESNIYINVNTTHIEFIAVSKGDLLLYNSFEYNTKEDFIYFILFTIEQLQLDTETITVNLSGDTEKEDELYAVLYKYIRFVEFIKPTHSYTFSENKEPKHSYSNFIILNSF
jgi:hypothetical protein